MTKHTKLTDSWRHDKSPSNSHSRRVAPEPTKDPHEGARTQAPGSSGCKPPAHRTGNEKPRNLREASPLQTNGGKCQGEGRWPLGASGDTEAARCPVGPFQGGELRLPAEPAASVARWTPRSPQSCSLADVGRPPRGRRPAGAARGPWSLWVESGPVCATKCWGTCDTQLSDGDAISVQGAVCCHRHAGCPVADSCPGGPQATPQAQLTHRGPLGWGGLPPGS